MRTQIFLLLLLIVPLTVSGQDWDPEEDLSQTETKLIGRWDITMDMDGVEKPSWLEISKTGFRTLVGRFVGIEGSARPISKIHVEKGVMSFAIPPQWAAAPHDLLVFGEFDGDDLVGTIKLEDGQRYKYKAVRAPKLRREKEPSWGKPIQLTEGKKLDEVWEATGDNQWILENGILKSPKSGSNLFTKQKFEDFQLHVEVRYPAGSNSGIYLRGRHEIQVVDSTNTTEPSDIMLGAVYGFIEPSHMAATEAGNWQVIDIKLVGRQVSVELNGENIIHDRTIPGITGGAIDSHEGEPGPILLQGDHGPVEYRNIIITPGLK